MIRQPVETGIGDITVAVENRHDPRKLLGSGQVDANDGAFIVRDANGFAVTMSIGSCNRALHDRYMTRLEAAMIAEAVAKLPKLLERARF